MVKKEEEGQKGKEKMMGGWKYFEVDGWMDGWSDGEGMDGIRIVDEEGDRWMEGWMGDEGHGWLEGWMDEEGDGWMKKRWMDGWIILKQWYEEGEVSEDTSSGNLLQDQESFEDDEQVPKKFDPSQTGNQSIRPDIVTCFCEVLNQECGLLPIPNNLQC